MSPSYLIDVATRCVLRVVNASKCVCSRGFALNPTGGACRAPQTPSGEESGCIGLWGEEKERGKGKEVRKMNEQGKGRGRDSRRKGMEGKFGFSTPL